MRALLCFFVFLIIYGSLYPFTFELDSYHRDLLTPLLDFNPLNTGRGDMVANLLLFIPFGFLAMPGFPGGKRSRRIVLVLLIGFVLAYLIQVAQLIVPGRTPSGSDAVWNLLGCAIGCALASLPVPERVSGVLMPGGLPSIPLALGLLWLAYNWAPFVPSIDLQLLKDNLKLISSSSPDPLRVLQKLVMWLVIFHFFHSTGGLLARERYYPLIVAATLFGSLFIVGHATTIEHVAGGVLAIPAWCLVRKHRRPSLLALLLGVSIVATTFTPFDLRELPATFSWIPFSGALDGNMLINVMAIFSKLVIYGSLTWLLVEAGFALRTAALIVAAGLLASELLQVYFRGPTAEITDPLLALVVAVTLHAYQKAVEARMPQRPTSPAVPTTEAASAASAAQGDGATQQGQRTIQLNLHRYQAAFVQDVAAGLGWSSQQLCSALLALAHNGEVSDSTEDTLQSFRVSPEVMLRDQRWVVLPVTLDEQASASLQTLAAAGQRSESSTLRQLIDKQINRLSVT
ncbi:VanZ family protein [Parahaliea aestuarii]|uniref:VanZ family protein n=1 Tax=Parahaliea aestuarii TaxID=1852021 RepID=A0A5C8ZM15_9GAMM|nr:VanZ family protein [Parahaliea aestuarii]TXS89606.1 VanZ family protein [Parahaliea aestuarii]